MATHAADPPLPATAAAAAPDNPSADALARRFTERWAADARYVAAWDRWMVWDGAVWRPDGTLRVLAAAREICRAAAEEVLRADGAARARPRLGSVAAVAAVERLARLDRRHLATADQWDADPWLINTPGGTVDLRDGALRKHRHEDYITRTTSVAPDGTCPRFLAALEGLCAGDQNLVAFVQRALGCALAGAAGVTAPPIFIACDPAGGGKSLLDTARAALGGYAAAAPLAALAAPPRGDAILAGARPRLTVATAASTDRALDTSTMEAAGARTAIFIVGSHPPDLRGVDAVVRRRLRVIPFGVTLAADEADRDHVLEGQLEPQLEPQLDDELPGILAWMIAGCVEWQRSGLAPPPCVAAASADYLAQEDARGDWLAESTERDPEESESVADLYASWCAFARKHAEPPGSRNALARVLMARGFAPCRIGKAGSRGYAGIRLNDETQSPNPYGRWARLFGL